MSAHISKSQHQVPFYTDVGRCARCGDDHAKVEFKPFTNPPESGPGFTAIAFSHWASCPKNGEPILLFISQGTK